MQVHIITKESIEFVTVIDLDKKEKLAWTNFSPLEVDYNWYKLIIPYDRQNITDIMIGGESIKHRINAGINTDRGYEIWVNGDLAESNIYQPSLDASALLIISQAGLKPQ